MNEEDISGGGLAERLKELMHGIVIPALVEKSFIVEQLRVQEAMELSVSAQ